MSGTNSGKSKGRQEESTRDQDGTETQQSAQDAAWPGPPKIPGLSLPSVHALMPLEADRLPRLRTSPLPTIDSTDPGYHGEPLPPMLPSTNLNSYPLPTDSQLPSLRSDLPSQGPPAYQMRPQQGPPQNPTVYPGLPPPPQYAQSNMNMQPHIGQSLSSRFKVRFKDQHLLLGQPTAPDQLQPQHTPSGTAYENITFVDEPAANSTGRRITYWSCCLCIKEDREAPGFLLTKKKCLESHAEGDNVDDSGHHTKCTKCPVWEP